MKLLEPGYGPLLDDAELHVLAVTEESKDTSLGGENDNVTNIYLKLTKTINVNDTDDLTYTNVAEVLEYGNEAGRRNYAGIPGNMAPHEATDGEGEIDADLAQVIITPPTGGSPELEGSSTEHNKTVSIIVLLAASAMLIEGIGLIAFVILRKK